jgi:predicted DNA-binding antitoxin AbrB/MazE fold protein
MTVIATYRNGAFVPESPVTLPEGARVEVVFSDQVHATAEELRARFPEAAGVMPKEDADEMRRIIDEEFGRIDPDDWA